MGIMNHNAVIATSWNEEVFERMRTWASGLPGILVGEPQINGEATIVLAADGSKEGWRESDEGDDRRAAFVERLERDNNEDGSSPWCWIEVGYGEYGQIVLRGNNKNRYNNLVYAEAEGE